MFFAHKKSAHSISGRKVTVDRHKLKTSLKLRSISIDQTQSKISYDITDTEYDDDLDPYLFKK